MAGKIRQMIDLIMDRKAKGNPRMEDILKAKMMLKGIHPNKFTEQSDDDPAILAKLQSMLDA
jgi:hypothetical protein